MAHAQSTQQSSLSMSGFVVECQLNLVYMAVL